MGNATSSPISGTSSGGNAAAPPAGCPMHKEGESPLAANSNATAATVVSATDALNPLNNIPNLAQSPSASQRTLLSLERTYSSIPRSRSNSESEGSSSKAAAACPVDHKSLGSAKGKEKAVEEEDQSGNWVYPSPQQFYNALMRKGKDTPEESIDVMVQIHNFLNEKAWDEIKRWEDRRNPEDRTPNNLELAKFEGRPDDLSPKARFHLFCAKLFPEKYSSLPPFDRHDWHVRRASDGTAQRYVIDYYSCPDDEQGNPVFSLDVRPAVDSPGAAYERMTEWARMKKEAWLGDQTGSRVGA